MRIGAAVADGGVDAAGKAPDDPHDAARGIDLFAPGESLGGKTGSELVQIHGKATVSLQFFRPKGRYFIIPHPKEKSNQNLS